MLKFSAASMMAQTKRDHIFGTENVNYKHLWGNEAVECLYCGKERGANFISKANSRKKPLWNPERKNMRKRAEKQFISDRLLRSIAKENFRVKPNKKSMSIAAFPVSQKENRFTKELKLYRRWSVLQTKSLFCRTRSFRQGDWSTSKTIWFCATTLRIISYGTRTQLKRLKPSDVMVLAVRASYGSKLPLLFKEHC